VVRTHPETGRKALYVNAPFTQYIVGMERSESDALLAHLYAQAAIPEYQCRFRWTVNAIAFWDNRASQHYAVSDYWPAVRRMERVTIVGDRPR
jgi:taurine dioxygenase